MPYELIDPGGNRWMVKIDGLSADHILLTHFIKELDLPLNAEDGSQISYALDIDEASKIIKILKSEKSDANVKLQRRKKMLKQKVFIVHGHDEVAKESVARCVEWLGLTAVILQEQVGGSHTIIENFEKFADVSYAIVLLTPDDIGASKENADKLVPRARQNVILELGFFIGKLGRRKVCALLKGDLDIPSDLGGVIWKKMDSGKEWQLHLAREMQEAGLNINIKKLIR